MIKVSDGRIEQYGSSREGAWHQLPLDLLTEMAAGKPLALVRSISREQLVEAMGGLPSASMHASHLAIEVLGRLCGSCRERPLVQRASEND